MNSEYINEYITTYFVCENDECLNDNRTVEMQQKDKMFPMRTIILIPRCSCCGRKMKEVGNFHN